MKLISYLEGFSRLFSLDLEIRQTIAVPNKANKIKRATMMDPKAPPITFAEFEVLEANSGTCIVVFATVTVTVVLLSLIHI